MGMVKSYLLDWWNCATKGAPVWLEIPFFLLGVFLDLIPGMPPLIPNICYALFALTIIFFVPYRLYVVAKESEKKAIDRLKKYEVVQDTLYKLSQYRDEVIKFQNRPAIDTAGFEAWIHEFDELREKIIDTIDKEISPAEAGIFRTICLFEMHQTKRPAGLSNLQHELIDNYRSRSIRDHKWLTSLIISYRGKG